MLKKRIIITLTFLEGVLFRTKKFTPDYRYTKNFIDLWSIDELILIDISEKKFSKEFCNTVNFFSSNCHVPITVGGGIKNLDNVDLYFKLGADKVVLGAHSLAKTGLINDISRKYVDKNIIDKIPQQYLEFENRNQVRNELDKEFNEYLKSLTYYPSMYNYIQNISFYKYIRINNMLLKTGVLIFIKDYDNKIYDVNDNSITDIGLNDIRTLKYKTNKIEISKHHLRFNLVLLDDVFLNQMIYQNDKNSSKIKINLIKNTHLKNIVQYLQNNNEQNFLIIDKI